MSVKTNPFALSGPAPVTRKALKRFRKRLPSRIGALLRVDPFSGGAPPRALTRTQKAFIEWNAQRLGIDPEESRARYLRSWTSVRGGHRRHFFNRFCETTHEVFRVFHEDSPHEVYEAYRFHAKLHFLRMLAREETAWDDDDPIVRCLGEREPVRILDFGCGLAQASRGLAEKLQSLGRSVRLTLADIPTERKPFLAWLCDRSGIPAELLDCTESSPIPSLPRVDLAIANDVFEHLHDPLPALEAILAVLEPEGFLVTDLADHYAGFMHVSPDLRLLTGRLEAQGYQEIRRRRVYRKPAATPAA